MKDLIINVQNISKTFLIAEDKKESLKSVFVSIMNQNKTKKFKAVNDVSFQVNRGEFVGIVGKNGSGKSTLLKLLAGIYEPDKGGELGIGGKVIPFLELGVGFNPELTGKENVFLNGTILGMTNKFIREKYQEIVEFAELQDFMNMPVKNYSSGMKVRLAFSVAVLAEADIYILDEIFSVGDASFRQKSSQVMENFAKAGKTIIYVSHNLSGVEKYCSRAIWINKGRIIKDGDTKEVVDAFREFILPQQQAKTIENDED